VRSSFGGFVVDRGAAAADDDFVALASFGSPSRSNCASARFLCLWWFIVLFDNLAKQTNKLTINVSVEQHSMQPARDANKNHHEFIEPVSGRNQL
jgi:hypothetical protein